MHSRLELVERILPPGRVGEALVRLKACFDTREDTAMWAAVEEAIGLLGSKA